MKILFIILFQEKNELLNLSDESFSVETICQRKSKIFSLVFCSNKIYSFDFIFNILSVCFIFHFTHAASSFKMFQNVIINANAQDCSIITNCCSRFPISEFGR